MAAAETTDPEPQFTGNEFESSHMNLGMMKIRSISVDLPSPLPARPKRTKSSGELPIQKLPNQFEGTIVSKPKKTSESAIQELINQFEGEKVSKPNESGESPMQELTNQFEGTKVSKPNETGESPIQELINQFEGEKVSKPNEESPSFAEALQSHQYHIKWTSCSDLPCKLYEASVAVSSAGDKAYVTAGSAPDDNTKNNVYSYNTNNDQWTVLPQPGHCFDVLHMIDDKLTIFGGNYHNKVTTYNNDTNSWHSEYPDMLNTRYMPGVIAYNNYVIVMGGKSSPDKIHDSIEIMNYHNELQWRDVSVKLPVPMWRITPTISGDNITIVGYSDAGCHRKGCYQIAIEEILNQPLSTSPTWKMLSFAQYYDTATVPYSNPPVIIGGGDIKGVPTCDITLYDSSKDSWRKVDSLTSARKYVGVALLNNNSIIVIGGTSGGVCVEANLASSLTTVEIGNIVPKL